MEMMIVVVREVVEVVEYAVVLDLKNHPEHFQERGTIVDRQLVNWRRFLVRTGMDERIIREGVEMESG